MPKVKMSTKLKKVINDFDLFSRNFIKIVDNNGNLVPFKMHEQQRYIHENKQKMNVILKGRQIGGTTYCLALMLYEATKKPNTQYIIVAHTEKSSNVLFERLKTMNNNLPREKYPDLFPKTKRDNRGELYLDNGSRILCQSADGKDAFRGNTYQLVLLSEMGFYKKDQEGILLSVEQALAKNDESRIFVESTANSYNYFRDLFMNAYKNLNPYMAFFFTWFESGYNQLFEYEYDLAEKYYKNENKGQRLHKKDLDEEEMILNKNGASLKQLMWRRWKLTRISKEEFQQEYPSNPYEAFQNSVTSVFDKQKVFNRMESLKPPLSKRKVVNEVPKELVKYIGKELLIYHLPKKSKRYWSGVDCAAGVKRDFSVMEIFDDEGEEVACFMSNEIVPYRFSEIVRALGFFYNYAFLTVERDTGNGNTVIEKLRKETDQPYLNMYKHRVFNEQTKRKKTVIGFQPSNVSKQMMINDFVEMFEKGLLIIHTKETLEQMLIFENRSGKLGNKAGNENHDDNVISVGLCTQGMKQGKSYI